ncbi:SDR family oxidoreductase [Arthrobacter sp. FW306-05-C]|uniref:SDR family oxidoreductase n=1 Tax=unclassified Arthrobacter TaxID=235627 RepID=UPI001EF003F4|nr:MULTISPECIES: SDR family oxidoreductase [unclassified Arthrobacter]UKA68308.1 SDR family oxidoreductase [Arthrobacter sp. FW306-05-C]UKA77067.1 SDR family oxidoreductase [Arthrobacter sp. FW306-07-I]
MTSTATGAATGSAPARVLVTGGSGASGIAVARALASAGHRVATVGSDEARIRAAAEKAGDGVTPFTCDLADLENVRKLRGEVGAAFGPVDAVIHLVGGWRGAKGIPDQTDDDWDFLERGAVTTLRNVSRVFFEDIAASASGRVAIVSSTALDKPTAAVASYVAAKAAAEAWTMAVADGFRRASEAGGGNAAATILVVKALVDDELRRAHPERKFPGATDVADLAAAVVRLFDTPSTELNGARLRLAD